MHNASVIIPFRGDADILRWTLGGFARQQLPTGIRVRICIGGDGVSVLPDVLPATSNNAITFHARDYPPSGAAAVRNALIREFPAPTLILANSDTRPAPDMVANHIARLASLPERTLVLGAAPWETTDHPGSPSVWDALLAQTPMIFNPALTPHGYHDFRHCWTLNLSLRHADFLAAGGFNEALRPVYYEDLALGWHLMGHDKRVYFDPAIRVTHRHPTTLADYLNREELLGIMATVVAQHEPELFAALWGNVTPDQLAADFQTWTAMDHPTHIWIARRLREWIDRPLATLDPALRDQTIQTLYQMHIPLKRLAFRLGFLRAHTDKLHDADNWQSRRPAELWRAIIDPQL